MTHGEWRLVYPGVDYTFGTGVSPVFNRKTPVIGASDIRTDDNDLPRGDGRGFGVDNYGGNTLSFDLGVRSASDAEVRAETARLRTAWRADPVRRTPGAVAELHAEYAGRKRVVYGRPRRFDPDYSDAAVNRYVTVLADFACVDDLFYGDTEHAESVSLAATPVGGLLSPLSAPLTTTATSDRSRSIDIGGEMPTWPVIEVHGPISAAEVEVVGVFKVELRTALAHDDVAVIDARPWMRSAVLNGAGNLSGALRGTRLAAAAMSPGRHEVALRGVDATGTASMVIRWREAFPTL